MSTFITEEGAARIADVQRSLHEIRLDLQKAYPGRTGGNRAAWEASLDEKVGEVQRLLVALQAENWKAQLHLLRLGHNLP